MQGERDDHEHQHPFHTCMLVSEIIPVSFVDKSVSTEHLEKHPAEGSLREVGLLEPLWLILSASERSLMASEAH